MNIYRLYKNGTNDTSNIVKEVLSNRGVKDWQQYLNLNDSVVESYTNLGNMIGTAVIKFTDCIEDRKPISILVDSDPDGFCSAAMMYLYIKQIDKDYPVHYILHKRAKAHGLCGDYEIPDETKLFIIPDAGTNDVDECRRLRENGTDIIILDHHEQEKKENPWAIIVNNQISNNYSNKDLCGAGIVYRFLQALDDYYWTEYADDYLDLVALANISDVMDMRSLETRYLVNEGLKNIKNKCLQALIKAQDYSMGGKVNIHNVQWSITPILNGMIRVGSYEEKELLFRAFIERDEFFEYKKRGTKDNPGEVIQESIYDRAARLCKNAKSRQDKLRDKAVSVITEQVEARTDESKIIVEDVTDILDSGLTGVVAIKIAEKFNKPCILLKSHTCEDGTVVYGGSARNMDNSPIESLKDVVNSTGIILGQGHANAFGIVDLPVDKKEEAVKVLNKNLEDVVYDSTYVVDFILSDSDVTIPFVYQFERFENIVAQGIKDPMVAVENIYLTRDQIEVFGKNEDTISFLVNDVKYIMFKCQEGNPLYDWIQNAWSDEDSITITVVGMPGINDFGGVKTAQIKIDDVNIVESSESNVEDYDDEDAW